MESVDGLCTALVCILVIFLLINLERFVFCECEKTCWVILLVYVISVLLT